jgi:hypothetical protein
MKTKTLFILIIAICHAKAQSLSLTPSLSPPMLVPKYTHSSLTNGGILSTNFVSSVPTFQTNTNTPIHFSVNNGSALMTLSNVGNMGLGNASPTERLDIKNGRIRFTGEKSAGNPSGFVFSDNSIPSPIFKVNMVDDNVLGIRDDINSPNFLMNVNTGNVGIGTPPATDALTVSGTIHNTQFDNPDNVSNQVIASVNGDLLKGELNKIEITPWAYSRFGTKTNNNFTIFANLGYYSTTVAGNARFQAPIHLPHNVKLKTIEAKLVDNSANSYIQISISGESPTSVLSVENFDSKLTPTGTGVAVISDIFLHTTDCNAYFYVLSVSVKKTSDDTPTFWDGSNLKIGTITITYGF